MIYSLCNKLYLLAATLTVCVWSLSACGQSTDIMCEHQIRQEVVSPLGDMVVALDDVGCGATVGFVTWILVAESDETLDPTVHKIAVLEGSATRVRWESPRQIVVTGDVSMHSQLEQSSGVAIMIEAEDAGDHAQKGS